jgi:hypothetical protein
MAFEVFHSSGMDVSLAQGKCSVGVNGTVRFHVKDLAKAGITGSRVTILIDASRRALAIRQVMDSEPGFALSRGPAYRNPMITAKSAFKAIGVNPADHLGWHAIAVKDDSIEVFFEAE